MTSQITTTSILHIPLVGLSFYPAAKYLIDFLPTGCELVLIPEPHNPYDEKAVKVLVNIKTSLPASQYEPADVAIAGTGRDIETLLHSDESFMLGHLADSDGKPLAKLQASGMAIVGNREAAELAEACGGWDNVRASLTAMPSGAAQVTLRARSAE